MTKSAGSTTLFSEMRQRAKGKNLRGFYGIHSTHPLVLRAAMRQALGDGNVLLVEFDGPQRGKNSIKRPGDYTLFLNKLACDNGFPPERLVIGSGQMRVNSRQVLQEEQSRLQFHEKAVAWVVECVNAGFEKIYLESGELTESGQIAALQADLCRAAENAFERAGTGKGQPYYVLGTLFTAADENKQLKPEEIVDSVTAIWKAGKKAFQAAGLEDAWQRVIALAVQPEMGYTDYEVKPYQSETALGLKQLSEKYGRFVYEVPSADYQPSLSVERLHADRFAILGIGPELTFTMREALFSLAMLENEWMIGKPGARLSNLIVELDKAMQLDPQGWRDVYKGNGFEQLLARKYSCRDLSRNYWQERDVEAAVEQLMKNLVQNPPPLPILRQFFAGGYELAGDTLGGNWPEELLIRKIQNVIEPYINAED